MDGMPLTKEMITTFYAGSDLQKLLDGLVQKGYLVYEHPKRKITKKVGNISSSHREQDTSLPKGYNIVTGKLSFEITKILDPASIAPTLVAMDMQKLVVVDGNGLRKLSLREGLRLFGYPEDYQFDVSEKDGFDLLGNTVVVPVIKAVCSRLLKTDIVMAEELIHITPEELYDKLLTDFNIKSVEGRITFCLGSVGIIVKQKDVVGNIIQEWLEGWLRANNIYFAPNPNTQMPPDIFLNEDRKVNLVEVKAFNSEGSAGFDIADFKSYVKEIIEKPYMLHVKYLIFLLIRWIVMVL